MFLIVSRHTVVGKYFSEISLPQVVELLSEQFLISIVSLFQSRGAVLAVYDMIALAFIIGWRAVLVIFGCTGALYLAACLTASQVIVWILSASFLLTLQLEFSQRWVVNN